LSTQSDKVERDRRSVFRRRGQWILITFTVLTLLFFGAAGYAVYNGGQERIDICDEVRELRNDVVRALDILTENSQAPDVKEARETIRTPHC
jgi:hypothetical protein